MKAIRNTSPQLYQRRRSRFDFHATEDAGPPVVQRRPVVERLQLARNLPLEEYQFVSSVAQRPAKVTLALYDELALSPKPGLVTLTDAGSHADMDAHTLMRSLFALRSYFVRISHARSLPLQQSRQAYYFRLFLCYVIGADPRACRCWTGRGLPEGQQRVVTA